ncbi:MAG: tripartite tricarboxylate transporter substrate binding protein [Beijerinckiaceae bacterium]|nr:tripartite tricarboxylate transporter substrate binding protein [Beijerinckiaceae bacterium]
MTKPTGLTRRLLTTTLAAAGLIGLAGMASAQQGWPSRPITLLNPFPAGGGTDAFARPLAQQLDAQLNQRVIIENRGGAGGTVGAAAAAKMTPDGYTFFVGAAHHTIAPAIYPNLTYDLEKDFVPIAVIAMPPQIVSISPKALPNVKTLKDFIDYAKANPGKINFASAGNGTTHHLAGELFKNVAGVNLVHVPYRGAGPAMQDLVAGQVHVMFDGLGTSAPQIQGGNLVGLALAAPKRSDALPNVPTAEEAGVKGYNVSTWYAVWAIKGTPPDIVERMKSEILKALQTEPIKATWARNGSDIPNVTGDAFAKFVRSEIERWGQVVKAADVKVSN